MNAGDVFFYAGTDAVSVEIRRVTGSRYSHVALALCADYLIEAVIPRVRVAPINAVILNSFRPSWPDVTGPGRAVAAALAMQGEAYDLAGAGLAGIEDVLRVHAKAVAETVDDIERHLPALRLAVYCSRLVARALVAGGVALPQPPDYCTPGDVALALTGRR